MKGHKRGECNRDGAGQRPSVIVNINLNQSNTIIMNPPTDYPDARPQTSTPYEPRDDLNIEEIHGSDEGYKTPPATPRGKLTRGDGTRECRKKREDSEGEHANAKDDDAQCLENGNSEDEEDLDKDVFELFRREPRKTVLKMRVPPEHFPALEAVFSQAGMHCRGIHPEADWEDTKRGMFIIGQDAKRVKGYKVNVPRRAMVISTLTLGSALGWAWRSIHG